MTTPTVVAAGYVNDVTDYLNAPGLNTGAARWVDGTATIPNGTIAGAFIGLVPFRKGAKFIIDDKSVHITDIDSSTDSLVNLGIIYKNTTEGTDDVDAFCLQSSAGQAGGFISLTNVAGLTYETTGDGWLALENDVNVTEAEGTVTFSVGVQYGS